MTTSNIYHYFGTKAGVLSTIERQTLEPIIQEFRRITSLDLPPLDRFILLIKTHLTYMDTHRKESKIFSLSEETLSSGKNDLNKKFHKETFSIYRSEIERLLSRMGRQGKLYHRGVQHPWHRHLVLEMVSSWGTQFAGRSH